MRIKPNRSRPVPLRSDVLTLNSGEPSPNQAGAGPRAHFAQFKGIQLEPAVNEVRPCEVSLHSSAHSCTAFSPVRHHRGLRGPDCQITSWLMPFLTSPPASSLNCCLYRCCTQLVERRVRGSLKLVQRGELTPQQALKSVVHRLAEELTESQYQNLIAYFRTKDIKGQLAPAKQLLLRHLTTAKSTRPQPPARDQHHTSDIENRAAPQSRPVIRTSTAVVGIADLGVKGLLSPDCNIGSFDTAKQFQAVGNKPLSWNPPAPALYQLDI